MGAFTNKTLLITGGTGSFGNAVLNRFLKTDVGEIRIFSRDEKKQDDMRHDEADAATAYDADKTRNHERVIQNVFADTRGARTVEADAGKVGRIRRQEEVTVARADKRHDDNGIHADAQSHREDDSDSRRLRIDEL